MTLEEIVEKMFHTPLRIESMWPFPVDNAPDSLIEALENYEDLPQALQPLISKWGEDFRSPLFEGHSSAFQDAFEELCATAYRKQVFGYIGVAATPVMTSTGENSSSFSWGHYHTGFLFAETSEKLLIAALEWADEAHNQDKLHRRAKGGVS
jgi:hypothetical protein